MIIEVDNWVQQFRQSEWLWIWDDVDEYELANLLLFGVSENHAHELLLVFQLVELDGRNEASEVIKKCIGRMDFVLGKKLNIKDATAHLSPSDVRSGLIGTPLGQSTENLTADIMRSVANKWDSGLQNRQGHC